MIDRLKVLIASVWPVLRLRTILLGAFLFVAALPGLGAIFLRVYENALVRRTEAELVAQAAALGATAALLWPDTSASAPTGSPEYHDRQTEVDLSSSPILPARPSAAPARSAPHNSAQAVARRMEPVFGETRLAALSSIVMLDGKGIVLNGPEAGRSLAMLPEVKSALGGRARTVLRLNERYVAYYPLEWLSRAANLRLHYARPVKVGDHVVGVFLVSRSPRALFRGIYEDRGKILLGIAVIFLILLFLTAVLSRAIVRPIESLSRATRELAAGRPVTARHPILKVIEIDGLFADFEQMAQSIQKRSNYLRDFAASVSHEFKTPLAAISGTIELLEDHSADMQPEVRERFLANMALDAERLSRMVGRLLELARADVLVGAPDARANAAPIIAAVADALQGEAFRIHLNVPSDLPALAIDAGALEAALTTLVENAKQAGASRIEITATRRGPDVIIDARDDGPGIPAADQDRIFDPFFTTKREQGGTGLGLSVARSLLGAYRAEIVVRPAAEGTHFRIRCPTDKS